MKLRKKKEFGLLKNCYWIEQKFDKLYSTELYLLV